MRYKPNTVNPLFFCCGESLFFVSFEYLPFSLILLYLSRGYSPAVPLISQGQYEASLFMNGRRRRGGCYLKSFVDSSDFWDDDNIFF